MTAVTRPARRLTPAWEAWDDFVAAHGGGFAQTSWWADFLDLMERETFGAVLRAGGSVVGGAIVTHGTTAHGTVFYSIADGPLLPPDERAAGDAFEMMLAMIDQNRRHEKAPVSHLRIEPRWAEVPSYIRRFAPPPSLDMYCGPRETVVMDLRASEPELLGRVSAHVRDEASMAKARSVGIVADSTARGVADFVALHNAVVARTGVVSHRPRYFEQLVALLAARDCGTVYFVEHDGARVAGAVIVRVGSRAVWLHGASLPHAHTLMSPYAFHYEMMRRAKVSGCATYDLWGIASDKTANRTAGWLGALARALGGTHQRFVPTLDLVFDPFAYATYLADAVGDSVVTGAVGG